MSYGLDALKALIQYARIFILTLILLIIALSLQAQTIRTEVVRPTSTSKYKQAYLAGKLIVKMKKPGNSGSLSTLGLNQRMRTLGASENIFYIQPTFPQHQLRSQSREAGQEIQHLHNIFTLDIRKDVQIEDVIKEISATGLVEYAEPWFVNEIFYQVNDALCDTVNGATWPWHLEEIDAREAWDIQRENKDVKVAVIDTGIIFDHDDLKDNIHYNTDDPIDGIDNDKDGYVDNYRGWDFAGESFSSPGDNNPTINGSGHGVGVAGTFAARTDNRIGTAGVCFNCEVMPLKASTDDLPTQITFGYQAIVYAADQGAEIINCSWGGIQRSRFGEDVVNYATIVKGAAVIAAAGNSGTDIQFFPAAYDRVISVANMEPGATKHSTSTYNYSLGVASPGHGILGPVSTYGFADLTGTSYASPVAAGIVAVIKARFPELTGFQAGQRLRVTTENVYDKNPAYQDKLGTGMVNMLKALTDPARPSIRKRNFNVVDEDNDLQFSGGDTINLLLDFVNYLEPTDDLQISLQISDPEIGENISLLSESYAAGTVNTNETFSIASPFRIVLAEDVPVDYNVVLKLAYTDASSGYDDFEYISFRVNRSYLDINVNNLQTTINSIGNFGFNDFSSNHEGVGFRFSDGANALFEGGFLVGNSLGISDNIRNASNSQDKDFVIQEQLHEVLEDKKADFEAEAHFSDRDANVPHGLEVFQHVYAFDKAPDQDYIILEYELVNDNWKTLENIYAGLFADWDITDFSKNACNYDAEEKLVFAYKPDNPNPVFYSIALLSESNFFSFATTNPSNFTYSDTEKFIALSNVPTPETASKGVSDGGKDIMHFISSGPFVIAPGGRETVAFALVASDSYEELIEIVSRARKQYKCAIREEGPSNGFDILTDNPVNGQGIIFRDLNETATKWRWFFGDGNTSEEQNPIHQYTVPGNYTISLAASDETCTVIRSRTLAVDVNTATIPGSFDSIKLFPNPNTGDFQFDWENPVYGDSEIQMYDLRGKIFYEETVFTDGSPYTKNLKINSLSTGVYIFMLRNRTGQFLKKFIKY